MDEVIVLGYSRIEGGALTLTGSTQSITALSGTKIGRVQLQAKIGNAAPVELIETTGVTVVGQIAAGATLELDLNNLQGFKVKGTANDVLYYRAFVI